MTTTKRFLVTDPCYLTDNDTWHSFSEEAYKIADYGENWSKAFNDAASRYFDDLDPDAQNLVGDTGFGDWGNAFRSTDESVSVTGRGFCADAGMFIILELTDKIEAYLASMIDEISYDETYIQHGLAQIINVTVDGPSIIKLTADFTDSDWTVISISNHGQLLAQSQTADEFDEE